MRTVDSMLLIAALAPATVSAQARDSGAYVVRLGSDTIAVERYVRTPTLLVVEGVTRLPQTRLTRLVVRSDAAGRITSYEHANSPVPGAGGMGEIITAAGYRADSIRIEVSQGTNAPRVRTIAGTPAMLPLIAPMYSTHAVAIARARENGDTLLQLVSSQGPIAYRIRVAGDSVFMTGPGSTGTMKAAWDEEGMALLDGTGTTFKVVVTRTAWLDPDSMARHFARQDALGRALGVLSPRDTIRARIAGAMISIAYGRPAARGRRIFDALVPFDQVWRMGANAATELETDHQLDIGGRTIPPGRYSVWSIPRRDRWTLIINRQTGQWGTSYDPAHDLARIDIPVANLAVPVERFTIEFVESRDRGEIRFSWDRTRAVARFAVLPRGGAESPEDTASFRSP